MSIAIVVDEKSLRMSRSGLVTGICSLTVEDKGFPGNGWDDFAIIVLGWWCVQLRELMQGAREAELRFMDGSYFVRVKLAGDDAIHLELFANDKLVRTGSARLSDLLSSLKSAGAALLRQCDANGWSNADIIGLRMGIAALEES